VVGRAIRDRRDKVVLATKCGLWWKDQRGAEWFTLEGTVVRRSLRPDTVRKELEDSLRRLDTDRIDLYQTHWPAMDPEPTPIQDTMATLLAMKAEGKIRAIGASNVSVDEVRRYRQVGPLDAVQPRYSILDRRIEADLLPACHAQQVAALVYSPLEQGLLTGAIGMDRALRPEEYRAQLPWLRPANRARVLAMLAGWRDLTLRYDCTFAQLVIAWTVGQPGVTSALCGARTPRQMEENAAAGQLSLQADDLARMRRDAEALGQPL
jgi:methylglyoxal reductase